MKIDILEILKNSLIGGRSGEMAYIYNNPFIFEIFNQWKNRDEIYPLHKNDESLAFKLFLKECLNEEQVKSETPSEEVQPKVLKRSYHIYPSDENLRAYKKLGKEIENLQRERNELLYKMAYNCNPSLADISSFSLGFEDSLGSKMLNFEIPLDKLWERSK